MLAQPVGQNQGTDPRRCVHYQPSSKVKGAKLEYPPAGEEDVVCQGAVHKQMPQENKRHEPQVANLLQVKAGSSVTADSSSEIHTKDAKLTVYGMLAMHTAS